MATKLRSVARTAQEEVPAVETKSLGVNADYAVEGDILTIRIDLSQRHGPSKSGKTLIIASSQGNKTLDGGVVVGLNAYIAAK